MGELIAVEQGQPSLVRIERDSSVLIIGGIQGTPGPQQIYDQATAPAPIPGYVLLWFQSGVSADPDDREMNLVVSP